MILARPALPFVLFLVACSCGGSTATPEPVGAGSGGTGGSGSGSGGSGSTGAGAGAGAGATARGRMQGIYYVEDGAPDPLRCSADSDCQGDTVVVEDGCCVRDPMPVPQTTAYHTWLAQHRTSAACQSVDCGPIPPPPQPPDCAFRVRCDEQHRCVNTCPSE